MNFYHIFHKFIYLEIQPLMNNFTHNKSHKFVKRRRRDIGKPSAEILKTVCFGHEKKRFLYGL